MIKIATIASQIGVTPEEVEKEIRRSLLPLYPRHYWKKTWSNALFNKSVPAVFGEALIEKDNYFRGKLSEPPKGEGHVPLSLNRIPGIYFLWDEDKITYIGRTLNVIERIGGHVDKQFTKFSFITTPRSEIELMELYYICKYLPRDNRTGCDRIYILRGLIRCL